MEKGEAFTGHRGEDDDIVKYQQNLAENGDAPAQVPPGRGSMDKRSRLAVIVQGYLAHTHTPTPLGPP